MPITIKNCEVCDRTPHIAHEVRDDKVRIVIWCDRGHWREEEGITVMSAIHDWNWRNSQDGED